MSILPSNWGRSLEQVKPSITFAKVQVRDIGLRSCSIRAGGDTLGIGVTIDDFRRAGICMSIFIRIIKESKCMFTHLFQIVQLSVLVI